LSFLKRNLFFRVNKFQWRILFHLIALGFSCVILILLFLSYLYADINNFLHTSNFFPIKICIVTALPMAALMVLITSFYLYYITNKMFGPYERISREISGIAHNKEKRVIYLRKGDDMFQELVDSLNELIRRIP